MDLEHTSLAHADAYLSHHGILGQKWGVRRYQNTDGTLTDLGKKRYAKSIMRSNLGNKSYSKAKVPKDIQDQVRVKLNKHRDELKQVQKDEIADWDYEYKHLWSNEKALNKYAGKMADDFLKDGEPTDRREELINLIKYEDVGQNLFEEYYLKDNPKEAKTYRKLQEKSRNAYKRQGEIEKEITNDLLGAYGDTTLTSIPQYGHYKNGRLVVDRYATTGAVLQDYTRREIEKNYRDK